MSATNGIDTLADFDVDPTSSIVAAFDCLAIQNEWEKKSAHYKDDRVRLVTNEFGIQFGNNWSHLGGWQALCSAVGIAEVPSSITQCKKLLKKIHVNIFDLIDAARSGMAARTFSSSYELAQYSKANDKVFRKVAAKQNKLLKFMLRHIFQ